MIFLKDSNSISTEMVKKWVDAEFLRSGWSKMYKTGFLQRDSYCNLSLLCSTWKYQKFTSAIMNIYEEEAAFVSIYYCFFLCVFELVFFCLFYWLKENWWNSSWNSCSEVLSSHLVNLRLCSLLSKQMLSSTCAGSAVTSGQWAFGYLKKATKRPNAHPGHRPPSSLPKTLHTLFHFTFEPSDFCREKSGPDGHMNRNLSSPRSLLRFIIRCSSVFARPPRRELRCAFNRL